MFKLTDQQLVICVLFVLSVSSLVGSIFVNESVQPVMVTITASVVSGLLGYLKGKE